MSLVPLIPKFIKAIECNKDILAHNNELYRIFEGDLLSYIEKDLSNQFSLKAFERIKHRISPINILKRMIDKLSKIYAQNPVRSVENGSQQDEELLEWYEDELMFDQKMGTANSFFNLFKNVWIMPYINDEGSPGIRAIPADQFIVLSDDCCDPTNPTHLITFQGCEQDALGEVTQKYYAYSKDEFIIFNSKGKVLTQEMANNNNPDGINPFGALPGVYINRSHTTLIPIPDSDTLKMTKIIPILLSDLNYAVMYQAFSIVYGINIDDKNIEMNPSSFLSLKSDMTNTAPPSIGVIKPQVDISAVIELIKSQLVFWLETRGIKAGSIGNLDSSNIASGVSKMVDEMDTSEDRQRQIEYFRQAEYCLWDLILNKMHPYWVATGQIENKYIFTQTADISIKFAEQLPLTSRGDLVTTLTAEWTAGFTSKRRAIEKLNPEMSAHEIDELIQEIDAERTILVSPDIEENNSGINESDIQPQSKQNEIVNNG